MGENTTTGVAFDNRDFKSDIVENIKYLFNTTCFCETDLNTKITMNVPGRTYTKLRSFKFNFNYLFTLSSKRKEIDTKVKTNVRAWLDMVTPYGNDGDVDSDYIRAGLKLFSLYSDELQKAGILSFKR